MKNKIYRATVALLALCSIGTASAGPARAMLGPGDAAPQIKGQSIIDGKVEKFDLLDAAKKKAVVLYFFPAAFTSG